MTGHGGDPVTACIDFGLDIPGNDYDEAEILRTLSLSSRGTQMRTTVEATFSTFGSPARIAYDFIVEDGFWKIDDIAGPGYRVSQIHCTVRTLAAAYCYQSGNASMRLIRRPDGGAEFDFNSWQGNGHSCSGQGRARAIDGGWEYAGVQGCRLRILVTPQQGLRLSDADWVCKRWMCGQRAVMDGLEFPRSSQIDCARLSDPLN